MMNFRKYQDIYVELSKFRITFFVAISGAVGYILAAEPMDIGIILSSLGIFLLSSGSSAINHIQEWKTDAIMQRTKSRPLPTSKITMKHAVSFALFNILVGLLILQIAFGTLAMFLGVMAIVWYNVIYTPMKKVSPLAVVPGAVIGAIPPTIGWVAAGGSIFAPQLLALALFFFIWQIPHFWFLLLIYDEDYQSAGFPTLTKFFSKQQITRMSYVWVAALAASCILIPAMKPGNEWSTLLLMIAGGILVYRTKGLAGRYYENYNFKFAFRDINIYVLVVVLVLSVSKLMAF